MIDVEFLVAFFGPIVAATAAVVVAYGIIESL